MTTNPTLFSNYKDQEGISFDLSTYEISKEEYLMKPARSRKVELQGYLLSDDIERFCNLDPKKDTWYIQYDKYLFKMKRHESTIQIYTLKSNGSKIMKNFKEVNKWIIANK
jgi:hypothetical protein